MIHIIAGPRNGGQPRFLGCYPEFHFERATMRRRSTWSFYNLLWFISYCSIGLSALTASALKIDATYWHDDFKNTILWVQRWTWMIVPIFSGIAVGTKGLRDAIGTPWIWHSVQILLNEYRDMAFEMHDDDALHYYRVTLFRHIKWQACFTPHRWKTFWGWKRWPWSGCLVPVARSGHTTQKSDAIFLAPDDADFVEGIAGATWAKKGIITVHNLPDINADPSDDNIKEYAERTFVSQAWVRNRLTRKGKL